MDSENSEGRKIEQPDYLIDISSIASCFKDYGPHALHYIYSLVFPSKPSPYNLLGNTVNLFFDDRVQGSSRSYMDCLLKTFHDDAVQFLSIDEEELRKVYFNTIAEHYANVENIVEYQYPEQNPPLNKEYGFIEPSFICPDLGISGRMDYLELHGKDGASIIELKSGKRDDFRKCSKSAHLVQTLLYAEVLHYCQGIDYEKIHTYLLYNKYPLLSKEIYSKPLVDKALEIRNDIIGYLQQIIAGEGDKLFTEETVENMYSGYNKLWEEYDKPQLLANIREISGADETMRKWFFEQLQFILREEELARLGEPSEIIAPMTLLEIITNKDEEVKSIRLKIKLEEEFSTHDFRKGDAIILYPIDSLETKAKERIIIRANIFEITDDEMCVSLRNKERKIHFEQLHNVKFACEHDVINSSVAHACRATFRMLQARQHWKELLIEGRTPEVNDYKENNELSYVDNLVGRILNTKDYFVLVGPPGTGKTSVVLRKIVNRLYSETNENILLLSFTHRAVDEICSTLEEIIAEDNAFLDYCRLGNEYDCNDERFTNHLLSKHIDNCKKRSELSEKIKNIRIFASTTSRLNINHSLLDIKKFDTIIVDESSQLLDYQYMELLTNAKRFILIGDHKQLPAVTLQNNCRSLFERLYTENKEKNPTVVGQLVSQGRMHPDIAKYANEMFYDNKLQIIPLPHQLETTSFLPRFRFIDVRPDNNLGLETGDNPNLNNQRKEYPKCNPKEAAVVGTLVERIVEVYKKENQEFTAKTLGIIVPYRNQISAIKKTLADRNIAEAELINIDTVERYQGSQRDIIIFSATVKTQQEMEQLSVPVVIENQLVDRKLNVIITRARKHLYIIGNKELLSQSELYQKLF